MPPEKTVQTELKQEQEGLKQRKLNPRRLLQMLDKEQGKHATESEEEDEWTEDDDTRKARETAVQQLFQEAIDEKKSSRNLCNRIQEHWDPNISTLSSQVVYFAAKAFKKRVQVLANVV